MTADLPDPSAAAWPWPLALDALSSAPRHHKLLLENARVRVLENAHSTGGLSPGAHTLLAQRAVRPQLERLHSARPQRHGRPESRASGAVAFPPSILWSEALPPHSLENVGAAEIRVISMDLKRIAA